MRFSWDFLQNMLENVHSVLHSKLCECIPLQIFSKYPIQQSRHRTNPPDLRTLKAYPTPGVGGNFQNFFTNMKGQDELEGTRINFTPWLCDFEHQGDNR